MIVQDGEFTVDLAADAKFRLGNLDLDILPTQRHHARCVLKYLLSKGYEVFPVNPGHAGKEIAGALTYASLSEIPGPVHMVDIFRNSDAAFGVVEEALKLDPLPKVIWMQLQVRNDEAAKLAEARGIKVVMNRCPKIEYARLCGEIGWAGVSSNVISSRKPKLHKGFQSFGIRPK